MPNKIITISTSLSDKFPINRGASPIPYYTYIGAKTGSFGASNWALINKSIELLLEHSTDEINNTYYRDVFEYLHFEPIIDISYKVRNLPDMRNAIVHGSFDGDTFQKILERRIFRRGGFRASYYDKHNENDTDPNYWQNLANIYTNIILKDINTLSTNVSFKINFSEKNFHRTELAEDILYKTEKYYLLEELRKYDLVQRPDITLYKKNGQKFTFSDASSGEVNILSTLFTLIPSLQDNSLILIDEPEISLHPNWQSQYINLIDRIMDKVTGCHIIIATHSHFIISDLPLKRSSVINFKSDHQSKYTVNYINDDTYGLSAEDILLNIFDMPSTRNYYLSKEVSEALELLTNGKKNSPEFQNLMMKFKKYLPHLKTVDPLHTIIKTLLNSVIL